MYLLQKRIGLYFLFCQLLLTCQHQQTGMSCPDFEHRLLDRTSKKYYPYHSYTENISHFQQYYITSLFPSRVNIHKILLEFF